MITTSLPFTTLDYSESKTFGESLWESDSSSDSKIEFPMDIMSMIRVTLTGVISGVIQVATSHIHPNHKNPAASLSKSSSQVME